MAEVNFVFSSVVVASVFIVALVCNSKPFDSD